MDSLTIRSLFLKDSHSPGQIVLDNEAADGEDAFSGIRCPQCYWRPSATSAWSCHFVPGTPEPRFVSCGTVWNTFATGGRCPGCGHQWRWTSCLRCHQWSPHGDWYEE